MVTQECMQNSASRNGLNIFSNTFTNTTSDWTQVRVFTKSKIGHIDVMLEPAMRKIVVKQINRTDESIKELYISAKNQISLYRILNLLTQFSNELKINTADMRHAQILLETEALRKQVEEFVNSVIENNRDMLFCYNKKLI